MCSNGNWMHILYQSKLQAKKVKLSKTKLVICDLGFFRLLAKMVKFLAVILWLAYSPALIRLVNICYIIL